MTETLSSEHILSKHSSDGLSLLVSQRQRKEDSDALAQKISSELGIHYVTAFILVQRGVLNSDEAKAFLSPTLRHHLPNPDSLKNATAAVDCIWKAVKDKKYITLFSDFDVDGITSASQMWHVLAAAGAKVRHYVPNRMTEGYGLSSEAITQLHEEKTQLLVTLDCGITNHAEISHAKKLGLEVIVIDHHELGAQIPPADIIVNPMQEGCPFRSYKLATAGIAWLLSIILLKRFSGDKSLDIDIKKLPHSKDLIDLAAIGTICDMVPLTGLNRLIASRGIDSIRNAPRPGIKALKEVANLPFGARFSCSHISFGIGPRLNAAGRLEDASLGFTLLTSKKSLEIKNHAKKIHSLNQQRKSLEEHAREICLEQVSILKSADPQTPPSAYALYDDSFHLGVIGIAAQRVVEVVGRPVAVMGPGESSIENSSRSVIKGSVRSIPEFHVAQALASLSHLLHAHGGHAQAGGFTLLPENLQAFQEAFNTLATKTFSDIPPKREIKVDCLMPFKEITIQLVQEIQSLAPFGIGNPSPLFLTTQVEIEHLQLIGDTHIKLQLSHHSTIRNAIGWRMRGHPLLVKGKIIDVVYALELNTYKGISSVQLIIKEILDPSCRS
jgi:single-stranded-DNA-specific exonuclease